ncbi:MAG: tRNA 2-thiouridine(34) synthase MnmA [Pseudodesulfovibrio sp.]|nr:tRNA 2-thiouridine(34) synthase MnmA [Pseudodesulfovibrio sp.]
MTIAVAVSGGMDSLLSLVLLKEQGHDIMAVHGHFLPPSPDSKRVADGLVQACSTLGVTFYALDLHEAFDACVVSPFARDYRAGLTPNPCAMCNLHMKFDLLFEAARKLGADRMATGHYVGFEECEGMGSMLVSAADASKDQSYFLCLVPIDILRQARFPLAGVHKKDVLALLAENGLKPPLSKESQEICFVPDDDYHAFLENRQPMPGGGQAVLSNGTVVGRHKGLWRYTHGQRRGLALPWKEALYVLDKDVVANRLVVGPKSELESRECVAGHVNLMVGMDRWPEVVMLQTRYRKKVIPSRVEIRDGKLVFCFLEPNEKPTPGQVAAVYTEAGIVLGGGIIEKTS